MNRQNRVYLHHFPRYILPNAFTFKTDDTDKNQEEIVERLINYYHVLQSEFSGKGKPKNDMWREIVKGYHDLDVALNTRNVQMVSDLLLNLCRHPSLVRGFMHYTNEYPTLVSSPLARQTEALFLVDKFLALADSVGVHATQNPEQGRWGYDDVNLSGILMALQERIPFDLTPPKAGGGSFGISTWIGIICMKDVQAIYCAIRARDLLIGKEKKTVCEIGGGTGTLAYYLAKAGMDQISVFDLPMVSIMQGYYLMKSLGPDQVSLHGEKTNAKIRLLPYWELENEPNNSHSLFINHDSMPEIETKVALDYMRLIKNKGSDLFWSINQEGREINADGVPQNVVGDLIKEAGGFRRIYRYQHWLRAGWIEELYEIQ